MPSRFSRYILQLLPPCNHTRIYPFHFVSLHIHSNSALAIKEIEYVFKFEDPIAYERCHPVFIYVIDLAGKPDPIMGKDTSPFDQCVERYLYSGQRIHYQIRDADLFMQFEELNWVYVYFASKTIIAVCRNLPSVSVVHGMLIPALSEIFRTDNCFFVHAAAVVKDSFGIMIAGPRASGKSTLAYNLGQNGYRIVSDDMVILDVNTEPLRVLACSDGMKIRSDLLDSWPALRAVKELPLAPDCPKRGFRINKVIPQGFAPYCCPHVILFPQIRTGAEHWLQKVSTFEAFEMLLPQSVSATVRTSVDSQLKAIQSLATNTRASYRLLMGSELDRIPGVIHNLIANLQ